MPDIYLVIGGSGFVGRHIVQQLVERGDAVSVLDIVQRYHDVPFYSADITDQGQVAAALRLSGTTCIIHTASPPAALKLEDPDLYWRVNFGGTKAIIAAAVETGVRKLVYTSSAGVVFNGEDLIDIDERTSYPEKAMDAYTDSKAKAEAAVLAANGKDGLLTVALRPAGIFGPGDQQVMAGLYQVYERGQTHFQIGDNTNLFDWTYVGNVAAAHLLAADRLSDSPPAPVLDDLPEMPKSPAEVAPLTAEEEALVQYAVPPVNLTTGAHRVPTSAARPLGPYDTPPPNADAIVAAFNGPLSNDRPAMRTRFDALSDYAIARTKLYAPHTSPLQVAGQAFFITNGEPCYFWDFARLIWHHLDEVFPEKAKTRKANVFVLPKSLGLFAATGAEWWGWLTGKDPTFTKFKVTFTCARRWYNIEKARRVLGYEPKVGVEEGVRAMIDVCALNILNFFSLPTTPFSGGKRCMSRNIRLPLIRYNNYSIAVHTIFFFRTLVDLLRLLFKHGYKLSKNLHSLGNVSFCVAVRNSMPISNITMATVGSRFTHTWW
ncbi:C-3 sterol dehydrogenase [Mycena pura]|uniref:C-3 sterol dehydrogenase n=1 Tax=Mycena pura TaxID=153505 RepID=A0AAD6YCT6_9AGAR|nr:C-3 sterol dehydrogenase [Mycena pura]